MAANHTCPGCRISSVHPKFYQNHIVDQKVIVLKDEKVTHILYRNIKTHGEWGDHLNSILHYANSEACIHLEFACPYDLCYWYDCDSERTKTHILKCKNRTNALNKID